MAECSDAGGRGCGQAGGVARPRWSNIVLPPCERRMAAAGLRLTRWADDCVGVSQTREEAPRALAMAARWRREARGVERHPQPTRRVHSRPGFAFLGDPGQRGSGVRLPAYKRRRRTNAPGRDAIPREQAVPRFQAQLRALTRRKAPRRRREGIARINPVMRGWGPVSRQAAGRRLFQRRAGWIEHRLESCLAQHGRNPMGRPSPIRRWLGEGGLVRLTHVIPGLVPR
jgi:hypothetical protein